MFKKVAEWPTIDEGIEAPADAPSADAPSFLSQSPDSPSPCHQGAARKATDLVTSQTKVTAPVICLVQLACVVCVCVRVEACDMPRRLMPRCMPSRLLACDVMKLVASASL
jgi:hypothetical protein